MKELKELLIVLNPTQEGKKDMDTNLAKVIRSCMTTSIKEKNETKKNILRVVLGELGTLESRSGKTLTDVEVQRVIKKVYESNNETASLLPPGEGKDKLAAENAVLEEFLPKTLSREDIRSVVDGSLLLEEIKSAKNDGQATGVLMKFLKGAGKAVDGADVLEVVKTLRS